MTTLDQLLATVDAARDEIVGFAQDLVRIPSVNHGARPDTGQETAVCEYLRDKLARDGIASEIHESAPGRGNLIARRTGSGGERLLLIRNSYRRVLSLPAGGLARGETPVDAARRELWEEVGIRCEPRALRYVGEVVDQSRYAEDHVHFFELRCAEEPRPVVDGREVVWAGFLGVAEARAQGVAALVRRYLDELRS